MAKVLTEKSNYEDIADAIREKTGTGETYLPSEMAEAIRGIHGDVTGVKGDAESNYRTGNVNLTPANVGAKATQTPVASPSASGTAVEFIDSISRYGGGVHRLHKPEHTGCNYSYQKDRADCDHKPVGLDVRCGQGESGQRRNRHLRSENADDGGRE